MKFLTYLFSGTLSTGAYIFRFLGYTLLAAIFHLIGNNLHSTMLLNVCALLEIFSFVYLPMINVKRARALFEDPKALWFFGLFSVVPILFFVLFLVLVFMRPEKPEPSTQR